MIAALCDFSLSSLLLTVVLVVVCLYLWVFTKWHYWKVRGIPYLKPVLPLLGNMYDILFLKSLVDVTNRIYYETKGLPFVGIYAFQKPVFFVRDLDLIAKILVNDFNHFVDRGFHYNNSDSLGRNLIHQSGADWRFSRSKLAPCFNVTKVKSMLPMIISKSEILVEKLKKEEACENVVEAWETSLRYATDVVTLYTFGVDANSLTNHTEQFREAGKQMLGVHFIYHVFTGCFFPGLHKLLGISVANKSVKKFFHHVMKQVVDYRKKKENNNNKKDVIQTLLQMKEDCAGIDEKFPEIDDNFVVAQAFIFFLAGYESPGNILASTLYEIAKHPHIQDALYSEITGVLRKHNNEVTFDALQDLKYLRQVISESLRKYSPLTLIFRQCTKDYMIPGTAMKIEKGTLVLIPLRSIHEDPEYYPDPETFDPERFSDENSATRHIAAYMPFGVGPRFCPAVLYSHIKIRAALVYILRQFEVCLTKTTPSSLQPNPLDFLFTPKDGIPLTFRTRTI